MLIEMVMNDSLYALLPEILQIEQLSPLIGKTATTIRTCATNAKYAHLIPRPFKLPGSRRLCWYKADVVAWLSQAMPVKVVEKKPAVRRGPPTKAEQIAAEQAGLTVKQWRAEISARRASAASGDEA